MKSRWRGSSRAISLRLRLLHLHDHVGPGEDLGGVGGDRRAGLDIILVGEVDADAGLGLDDHLVAGGDQLGDRGRGQADAIFVNLDFLRHADAHLALLMSVEFGRVYNGPHRLCRRCERIGRGANPRAASAAARAPDEEVRTFPFLTDER